MKPDIDAIRARDVLEDVIDTALDFLELEFSVKYNEDYIYTIGTKNFKEICKIKFFETSATNKVEFSFIYRGKESDKYSLTYTEFKEKVPNVLRALKRKLFDIGV